MSSLPAVGAVAGVHPQSLFPTDEIGPVPPVRTSDLGTFGAMVGQGLAQVDQQLQAGQTSLQRLATGDLKNIHQVMIQLEESRLSFQLMLQIRGRLLEAYQDVMKMQI